jgi:hypothetical protein
MNLNKMLGYKTKTIGVEYVEKGDFLLIEETQSLRQVKNVDSCHCGMVLIFADYTIMHFDDHPTVDFVVNPPVTLS